jgi:hypothetical protein
MAEVTRLDPHDPLPERGPFVVVMRRFGEDDPNATLLEIVVATADGLPETRPAIGPDDRVLDLDGATALASRVADAMQVPRVLFVDRTAGQREAEVIRHHGDHSFAGERLEDTDPEDGEAGTSLRDRPQGAGYLR